MKKRTKETVISVLLVVAVMVSLRAGVASAEIRIRDAAAILSAAELQTMYAPLAEYLARETGEKVSIVVPKTFDDVQTRGQGRAR